MSPLEAAVQQLAQLLEPTDVAERGALVEVLRERLFQLLAVPAAPLEIHARFGNPFDSGQLLADWCRARLADPRTRESALAPLLPIAALLDFLTEHDLALFVFVPWWFRIDDQGRPLLFPPQLALGVKQAGQTQLSERQRRTYTRLIHSSLLKTLSHCDVRSSLLFSFALFLARLVLNIAADSRRQLFQELRRCRQRNRTLPPELPELLHGVLAGPLDRPPGCSLHDLAGQVLELVHSNPFVVRSSLNRLIEHELFAYSVFGLNKDEPVNEDRVLCRSHGPISFALVADGVSQVDLGSGEMAAEEVIREFRQRFQERFDTLAGTLWQQIEANPEQAWTGEVERFLQEFFFQTNRRVVALANQLLEGRKEEPEAPLCTTLTVAVVVYDQALIACVGDSPALLFRRASGRLSQLTTANHAGLEEGYDPEDGIEPTALTRVIGQCHYDPPQPGLQPEDVPVPVVRVQLDPGDLLLLASDGLVECINEATNPDRLARMESELQRLHLTDHPLKELVRDLIRLGEEGLSDDNITAAAIRIRGAAVVEGEGVPAP